MKRFDALTPVSEIVSGLNEWQPVNLVAYASMARVLADEQLAGRLHISPKAVMCSSEVLSPEAATIIERAWGARPFNVYASTETAAVASECRLHRMHLCEDLVIPEAVDEKSRPVPAGTLGAKILVTVLFSRTQPLIRYEMSDRVSLSTEQCGCGLPFRVLSEIEGRAEDSLVMHTKTGAEVVVRPILFHRLMEPLRVQAWQIIQEPGQLRILLRQPEQTVSQERLASSIKLALHDAGAEPPPLHIEIVGALTQTTLGKTPLIRSIGSVPQPGIK